MSKIQSFLSLWFFGIAFLFAGSLTLHVDPPAITKGEGVNVTLTAKGTSIVFPKITTIGGFPVGQPQVSQKIQASYINGTMTTVREKSLRFTFFPDTNVTIPSFAVTIDGHIQKTKPVTLPIGTHTSKKGVSGGYTLKMVTQRHHVYVGEPLLLQVIFYEPRNSTVAQAQYIAPKFDGFFVKSSPKERLEQTAHGTAHIFDYILTPQKEGTFTITAPQIKLGIQTFSGARDPWGLFNNEVHWKTLRGTPQTITVKPIPSSTDLVGTFTVKTSVDSHSVHANKPVNYSIVFDGEGNLDDIDEPTFDLPNVTTYSSDPHSTVHVRNHKIVSHWVKKYTFIADHDFTIPARTFHVFDPKTGQTTTLKTTPYTIRISGKRAAPAAKTPLPSAATHQSGTPKTPDETPTITPKKPKPTPQDTHRSLLEDTAYYAQMAQERMPLPWWSLIVAFFLGMIATLAGYKLLAVVKRTRAKTPHRKYTPAEALDLLYPHTNDSPEIEAMVRELYQAQRGKKVEIDRGKLHHIIKKITTD